MPVIALQTRIHAPCERVFDLARCVELHLSAASATGEKAIAGVTKGLLGPGDEVTWEARHFMIRQRLQVRMTEYRKPDHFQDVMLRGAFRSMVHDHFFVPDGDATLMTDRFDFRAPLGFLGRTAERVFLTGYMRRFLIDRNRILKEIAESEAWRKFLPAVPH